jgi:signal transduction histidine kinase
MAGDETPLRETTGAGDRDAQRRQEMALLCAIAAGATLDEAAASLSPAGAGSDPSDIARLVADLERRGLLRAADDSQRPAYALTASGRRLLLGHLSELLAGAATLAEERRRVERLRTDLLSTISHELRTPLTLIRTSIGLLLDSDPDEEMRQRLLRNIKGSTDRMHALVGDLLDLARMSGDRLELQVRRVDLGDLMNGAISLLRPLIDAKEQRVNLAMPSPAPAVPGDYRRLERVMLNLLGNANKFAPERSEIAVTVTKDAREVTVAVRDSGPGISSEAMPHLFEQFFTDRTSSSRHNIGAGLGLPIAKGIIEAHGGRIWVESAVGAGTTVSFALPNVSPEESPDESPGRR